jgi:hypothetical protein
LTPRKASDVFVECLEAEGVQRVFGIPGEETLDLNESLANSSIEFVPVRHEQGGAYMADVYGRLTGHAGVCRTLGPGVAPSSRPDPGLRQPGGAGRQRRRARGSCARPARVLARDWDTGGRNLYG